MLAEHSVAFSERVSGCREQLFFSSCSDDISQAQCLLVCLSLAYEIEVKALSFPDTICIDFEI